MNRLVCFIIGHRFERGICQRRGCGHADKWLVSLDEFAVNWLAMSDENRARVLQTIKRAGFSIDELTTAFAQMARTGFSTDQLATALARTRPIKRGPSMTIPRDPTWCSDCLHSFIGTGILHPCRRHRGPTGEPAKYEGEDAYDPSVFVLGVVGNRYRGADARVPGHPIRIWKCFGYDPRHGFWMCTTEDGLLRSITNISEHAIDRTFHRVRMTLGAGYLLALRLKLGRELSRDEMEARGIEPEAAKTLEENGLVDTNGRVNEAGIAWLTRREMHLQAASATTEEKSV